MNVSRKGFAKLPLLYADMELTRDECALLFQLHLRKRYKKADIEFQPNQSILVDQGACLISVRDLAQVTGLSRMTAFRGLRRLQAKGLIHLTPIKRACLIVRVLTEQEIEVSRTVVGQLERALSNGKTRPFSNASDSTGTVVGQTLGHRIPMNQSQKEGVKAVRLEVHWDSMWDTRCFKNREKTVDASFDAAFGDNSTSGVDNSVVFGDAPFWRPHSPYGAILGNLAIKVGEPVLMRRSDDTATFPMVPGPTSQFGSDNVYAVSQNGLKNSGIMPTCASVRPLRLYPQREDFPSHAAWFRAQYEPLRKISDYVSLLNGPRRSEQRLALTWLREVGKLDNFKIAAAIRDVDRNGEVGSCAWEQPLEGIALYLKKNWAQVLARIERQAYQRERRRLGAGRARERRRFQLRSPKVNAFVGTFRDRRKRRLEMDYLRSRFPVFFREIERASVAELSVCAQLWGAR